MILIRPFRVNDFNEFEPIEPLTTSESVSPEFAQAIEDSELAVTGLYRGKVILCSGVHPIDDFHGEIWLRLSEDCLKYKIGTLRLLKEGLKIIEETYPFKQINAAIRECFEVSLRMIEYLGFTKTETRMIDEKKYFIYSKRIQE